MEICQGFSIDGYPTLMGTGVRACTFICITIVIGIMLALESITLLYLLGVYLKSRRTSTPFLSISNVRLPFVSFHVFYFGFVLSLFITLIYLVTRKDTVAKNDWMCYWSALLLFCPVIFYTSINLFWFFRLCHVFNNTVLAIRPLYQYLFMGFQLFLIVCEGAFILAGAINGDSSPHKVCSLPLKSIDFVWTKSTNDSHSSYFLCGRFNRNMVNAMIILGAIVMPTFLVLLSSQYIYRMYQIIGKHAHYSLQQQFANTAASPNENNSSAKTAKKKITFEQWLPFQRSFIVALCAVVSTFVTFLVAVLSFSNGVILMSVDGFVSSMCMLCVFSFGDSVYQHLCKVCIRSLGRYA
ncbi:hypothetical protein RFI_05917 [Reticulomyxa filosa]|uniref:Uncharacterized protein n=1 Tax=Reticulomyxa filosa TaxID=46433 RepID=X6NZ92_RETFI|nr:hypothetical protein RFI_05917 [Reticulomyxa filosa]|eukprot:ETO31203.1 hypothetical protein RFI_05917 [Reticulomyxa filosa]